MSSFIKSEQDEQDTKEFVEKMMKELNAPLPNMCGYHMMVKIFVREENIHKAVDEKGNPILGPDGRQICIELPDSVSARDKYTSSVALVLAMGNECYRTGRFKDKEYKPWCKVGDWVLIARNEGIQFSYAGVAVQVIPDDRILAVLPNPELIEREAVHGKF